MTKQLQILSFMLAIFCGQWVHAQVLNTDTWQKVKAAKKGTLWVVYTNNKPFIMESRQGPPQGLEPDIVMAFVNFVKTHYHLDLQVNWKRVGEFKECYNTIKSLKAGAIACAGFSITDERKQVLQFSKAYMPDIEVLMTSHNVPIFANIADFAKAIHKLKAITIRNTTFEQNFKDLRTNALPGFRYSYVSNGETMRDSCVNRDNFLAYTQLPNYIMMLQNGKRVQRQRLFGVIREGLALALPLKSEWKKPLDLFFRQPGTSKIIKDIINKHFGNFASDLITDAAKNSDDAKREARLLSTEQRFQELLIQKAKEEGRLQTRIAYLILISLLVFVGGLGWFLYNRDKIKKRARVALAKKNLEIEVQAESLKESYKQLALMSDIGKLVIANLEIEDIIKTVYEQVLTLMPTQEFGIGVYDPATRRLVYEVYFNRGQRMPVFSIPVKDNNRMTLKCFTLQQEIVLADMPSEYNRYLDSLDVYEESEMFRSMMCLPLIAGGQTIGIINVQHSTKNAYKDQHLSIFRNLANYATIAIQNAKVFRQLELQKNNITASIDYARQIQQAMLPVSAEITRYLSDVFVLFKPRDIVSGDFYYFAASADGSRVLLAAIDCTGHGVPGAFMSLIGNDMLNGIIEQQGVIEANQILNLLHQKIRKSLRQNNTSNRDGMDVALCIIDQNTQTLEFAGAMNSLVYVQNGELKRLIGDKMPVGGEQREKQRVFQKQLLDISVPTTFYLYSDGFQDQFGGEHNQKFMAPRFRQLLYDIYHLPMHQQKKALDATFTNWRQDVEQLDDILVIGVKV